MLIKWYDSKHMTKLNVRTNGIILKLFPLSSGKNCDHLISSRCSIIWKIISCMQEAIVNEQKENKKWSATCWTGVKYDYEMFLFLFFNLDRLDSPKVNDKKCNWYQACNAIWDKFLQYFMHSKYVRIYNSVNTDSAGCILSTIYMMAFHSKYYFFIKPQHVRSSTKENVTKKSFEPKSTINNTLLRERKRFFSSKSHSWMIKIRICTQYSN